ncbi:hypothetical protein A7979_07385 [Rothia nasimurium]|uniref:Uncharacterized protein n=1 Tax=Rothia nasimurium TaxID=85336 RepID=A0A1Y1RM81_9MICC|nr:hypothetical protein [Rothia nasimurium]ORC15544.1 hypothetical protein A7979_07385 [Rothia nasimurium]
MKSLRTSLGVTALVGLSLTMAPNAFAVDTPTVDTTTAIGTYWSNNQDALGQPTGNQQTFANGATQQVFENGVVTQGKYGGVQAITGKAGQAFVSAGGAEKFGNAESAPWKHGYCGLSVTTSDSKTRWLVVLDEQTQPGSYLDLKSAEAKAWQAERSKTRSCFTNNAAVETPIEPVTEVNYGNAAQKIADARATALANGVQVAETGGELIKATDDLVTQDFGDNISAVYSMAQDRALMINTDALKAYLADPATYGQYLYQNEYTTNWKTGALELRALFYNSTAENCSTPVTGDDHGYALFSLGGTVISHYFIQYNDYGTCINWDNQTVASPIAWGPGLMDRTAVGTEIDATYDWSAAKFIPLQQVLELRVDAAKVVYIKADAAGKPLAGAKPVESSAMTEALKLADRGRFSAYNDWANGGNWNIWNEMTMLGAPVAAATEATADDGTVTVSQEFEGGTLVWTKGSESMSPQLNDLGKAKLDWYNSLGL